MRTLSRRLPTTTSAPASLANGWIGLRIPLNPLIGGTCTVSGFMGPDPEERVDGFAPAPYPLGCDVRCQGWWLSQRPELATVTSQELDLAMAELRTGLRIRCGSATVDVQVQQFVSRAFPTVAVQRITATSDQDVALVLRPAPLLPAGGTVEERHQNSLAWRAHRGDLLGAATLVQGGERAGEQVTLHLRARTPGTMTQLVSLVCDRVHPAPHLQAQRLVWLAGQEGYDRLRAAHAQAWAELWRGRPVIDGPADDQTALDAAYFHLHSAVHPGSPSSTGLFGLSRWPDYHYFRGHVFWDLDTFAVPPLALTDPGSARALIDYRVRGLPAARAHAAMHGWRGAQFPWESGPRGEEVTPTGWPHIQWEQHVSPDVAMAAARLAQSTGSDLRERVWPILAGVAEWLESRISDEADGAHIRRVTGIDEAESPCDDNCWTNAGAIVALEAAISVAQQLGESVPTRWRTLASRMTLPREADGRALAIRAGWTVGDTPCPDAGMSIFPLGANVSEAIRSETLRRQLAYAEPFLGMPMHPVFHAAWAALLGDRALAAARWKAGFRDYLFDDLLLIDEFGGERAQIKPRVGPYIAHCAGILRTVYEGFCGLVPGWDAPDAWCRRPVCLPEGWKSIRVERLWIRGEPKSLEAVHGQRAVLRP